MTHRQRFLRPPLLIQQQRTRLRSLQGLLEQPRPATRLRTILAVLRGLLEPLRLRSIRAVGLLRVLQRPTPQRMGLARRLAEAQAIPRHSTRQRHLVAQVRQHLAVLIWWWSFLLHLLGITVVQV